MEVYDMSRMKDWFIGELENLEKQTGYEFDFLQSVWWEVSDKLTFEEFRQITLEKRLVEEL